MFSVNTLAETYLARIFHSNTDNGGDFIRSVSELVKLAAEIFPTTVYAAMDGRTYIFSSAPGVFC